ncbi:MAG: class I SAM-dependent methyltransferase [bacterium]|nr:class I SAM-dependent methyltransferase [bacterium]MDZ4285348.1 class I SAM-dependent methyltransferase [Candidatus Sungbacteria bacterium]
MMDSSLSPQELQTLASYEEIAAERSKRRGDIYWWGEKFCHFSEFIGRGMILDIGCGHGKDAIMFEEDVCYRYVGIDISTAMMKLARTHAPHAMFARMNMYQLGFPSQCFSGFWAAASLLHIPKSRITEVLTEIKRVMKSGAIGFIALREGDTEEMVIKNLRGDNRFYAFYRQEEFSNILRRNDFEVLHADKDLREYQSTEPDIHNIWLTFIVRNL